MIDQVSSTGSLASGLPATLLAAGSAKSADPSPQGQDSPAVANVTGSPGMAVEQINSHLRQASTQLELQVDTDTGKTIYKIVDPTTGQVVLQVPSAQVLAMAHTLQTMDKHMGASGVLMDKKS